MSHLLKVCSLGAWVSMFHVCYTLIWMGLFKGEPSCYAFSNVTKYWFIHVLAVCKICKISVPVKKLDHWICWSGICIFRWSKKDQWRLRSNCSVRNFSTELIFHKRRMKTSALSIWKKRGHTKEMDMLGNNLYCAGIGACGYSAVLITWT